MRWLILSMLLVSLATFCWVSIGILELGRTENVASRVTGMGILQDHACQRAEVKHVTVRGIEDDFSTTGIENTEPHPRLKDLPVRIESSRVQLVRKANFDDLQADTQFWDYLPIPSRTASGIIVIKIKSVGDTTTDSLEIGDFSTRFVNVHPSRTRMYAQEIRNLVSSGDWKQQGDIFWAALADLELNTGGNLIDLIASSKELRVLDVSLGDDTAVDFIGIAACEPPDRSNGVTLFRIRPLPGSGESYVAFDCQPDVKDESGCNPFIGETPCSRELPLLCVADRQAPGPRFSHVPQGYMTERMWSGGEFAATTPVRADKFATIADADAYCAASFGSDFRAAEWHLAGSGWRFSGFSRMSLPQGRFWIDIRGQPYGTCWKRNEH